MVKEIYCRMPSDINYFPILDTSDELEQILQRVRVVLGTKPGEVLGDPTFGIDLESYVFSMSFSPETLQTMLTNYINNYVQLGAQRYSLRCEVNYGHDVSTVSDYAVIDIYVNEQKALGIVVS